MNSRFQLVSFPILYYIVDRMKSHFKFIANIALAVSLAAGIGVYAEDSKDEPQSRRSRNYSKRRYYTKRINLFDSKPEKELKVPEKEESRFEKGSNFEENNSPMDGVGDSLRSTHRPSAPIRRSHQKSDSQSGWLVKALMQTSGESDESGLDTFTGLGNSEEADWGWLAKDAGVFAEREQYESADEENEKGMESLQEEQTELLRGFFSGRSSAQDSSHNAGESARNINVKDSERIFRDHEEEGRGRYAIFKEVGSTPNEWNSKAQDEENPNSPEGSDRFAERRGDMEEEIHTELDKYQSSWLTEVSGKTEDPYARRKKGNESRELRGRRGGDRSAYSRQSSRNETKYRQSGYGMSNQSNNGKYGSPFSGGMSSKFKSPFKSFSDSGSSFGNQSNGGSGNRGGGYSRYKPAGSSYGQNRRESSGYSIYNNSRNSIFGSSRTKNKFERTKKKLPHSINQWD